MAETAPEPVVKFFVAVLAASDAAFTMALDHLRTAFGEIDFIGPPRPFDVTDYYVAEMGTNLVRRLVAFSELCSPERLSDAKLECNAIETRLAHDSRRVANLDIGYLDHNKLVLASVKGAGQKIYLSRGVYADLAARFKSGRYQPFEWTFPDFRDGRYDDELAELRRRFLEQRKTSHGDGGRSQG